MCSVEKALKFVLAKQLGNMLKTDMPNAVRFIVFLGFIDLFN